MGYALPAAIGAKLARPERPVVALIGDGGFAMSAMELLTAVRERVPLTVIVFNDGYYGLIRKQQIGAYGHSHGTTLSNPDIRGVAESAGARLRPARGGRRAPAPAGIRRRRRHRVEVLLREQGPSRPARPERPGLALEATDPGSRSIRQSP